MPPRSLLDLGLGEAKRRADEVSWRAGGRGRRIDVARWRRRRGLSAVAGHCFRKGGRGSWLRRLRVGEHHRRLETDSGRLRSTTPTPYERPRVGATWSCRLKVPFAHRCSDAGMAAKRGRSLTPSGDLPRDRSGAPSRRTPNREASHADRGVRSIANDASAGACPPVPRRLRQAPHSGSDGRVRKRQLLRGASRD